MKEKFIKFLKDNGALEKFRFNLEREYYISIETFLEDKEVETEHWIDGAFLWPIHQWKFWKKLNSKWVELCR